MPHERCLLCETQYAVYPLCLSENNIILSQADVPTFSAGCCLVNITAFLLKHKKITLKIRNLEDTWTNYLNHTQKLCRKAN